MLYLRKGFLHSKMILVDDVISTVGTANFDIRSFKMNFEVNAFIYDKVINSQLQEQFMKDIADSKEITKAIYENRAFGIKFKNLFQDFYLQCYKNKKYKKRRKI